MIGFALVGCGRISRRYIDLLTSNEINNSKLVAVCDINQEKVSSISSEHQIPGYTDMHEMMQQSGHEIDIVCILTESGNHAQHCIQLAQYKKHIIVEKPMALTLDDADAMIQCCDKNQIKLFVVKQNRFNLPVIKLREAIEEEKFGKLVMGTVRVRWCREQSYYDQASWRGTWAMDGGVFTNQASHHIDMLEWMLGDPVSVFAKTRTALVNIEAEDTGVAIIKFKSGALGVIEATTATRPKDIEGSLSILGENGMVEIGGFAVNKMLTWNFNHEQNEDLSDMQQYSQNPPDVYGFGHKAYLNNVTDSVNSNTPALIDGLEGRKSLELISAIYESVETGKEVFLRFQPKKCQLGRNSDN